MSDPGIACPRCSLPLGQTIARDVEAAVCGRCSGIWLDRETFRQLCAEPERYARIFGPPLLVPAKGDLSRHLSCPSCAELMTRKSFPKSSAIVIDLCLDHGVWFDHDELQRILAALGGESPPAATSSDSPRQAAARPPRSSSASSEAPVPWIVAPPVPPVLTPSRPPDPPPLPARPSTSLSSGSSDALDSIVVDVAIEGVIALIGSLFD